MKKTSKIPEQFTYMHPNEAAGRQYEAQRFAQLVRQQSQQLNPEQLVVMTLLSEVLFPKKNADGSEYLEQRADQFRDLLRQFTEVKPINLKTISAIELRKILDEFHQVLSDGASNENRTYLMQNMVSDYGIKRLLHRVRGYRDSPSFYSEMSTSSESVKHQSINLRACGFAAKADICDKHMRRYLYLESILSSALEQLPEEEVVETITSKDGINKLMRKLNFPLNVDLVAFKERCEKIKAKNPSAPEDIFAEMSQFKDLLPTDLPQISEKSHQRANYLITNQFTTFKDYESWQQCLAPVYFMYAHPRSINKRFEQLVNQINSACQQGVDPVYLAAWAHCKLQEIHPYQVANKRTSRVLMNLILALNNIPVQEFTTPLEIHAYQVALFNVLFQMMVPDEEKAQYKQSAFYDFLKNKIALANNQMAWESYLQKEFIPKHERDVGLAQDIREILNDTTQQRLADLILSMQSFLQQRAPSQLKQLPAVSFFKPKTDYAALKIIKHNLSLQKQVANYLDDVVTHLKINTITKEGTSKGWRVFNTSQEGCFMAQVDCLSQKDQIELQAYLESIVAKVLTAKSKQQTYIVRVFFEDIHELAALKPATI